MTFSIDELRIIREALVRLRNSTEAIETSYGRTAIHDDLIRRVDREIDALARRSTRN